ncbi:calcium-binding protein [Streptomyces sp. NPDC058457]|uniref:calcium-binding protein n=1 Tax=Streptomyces sp. NPDC058457 TaxID=3346507 RepID=UPI00364B76E6
MAATLLALLLALPGTAVAAPGDLDTTFAGDGTVLTDFGGSDSAADVALQPDGRIVSVGVTFDSSASEGDFALTRHNADGSLDTTFDGDGRVTTAINNLPSNEGLQWSEAHAMALQPDDGNIVVAGSSWRGPDNCCWFTLARYKAADGSLDPSFGNGDGRVFTDFGVPEEATDVVALPGGKIVAAGSVGGDAAVARYNPDGTLDQSFGGDGKVTTALGSSSQEGGDVRALAVQPDGKVVVAGEVGTTRFDFVLVRYNTDGSLDTGFGTNGIQRTDFGDYDSAEALAVQPDGRIVAAGSSGGRTALARYNPDGTPDPAFGGNGQVVTPGAGAEDMKLQSDGRIVVAGTGPGGFTVLRYNTDGGLDSGFGNGGRVATSFGGNEAAHGVAVQPDGRIVAVGQGGPGTDFALARYLGGAGTPPPPPRADLSVTKTGPSSVTIGDRATYTVRVTNAADSTASATGITLTDTLSGAGATLASATPVQGSCTTTATGATCALGTLAPGTSTTVTVVAEPRATGTLRNTATVTATPADPATGNNTATATGTVNNSRGCTVIGTSGTDTLDGTNGNDVICGLGGNDTLRGNGGTDTVYGDYGNDTIDGGLGNDTLYGGPGNDIVNGSSGNDRVVTTDGVSGNDTANGGVGTDTCTTDPGDTRISCP